MLVGCQGELSDEKVKFSGASQFSLQRFFYTFQWKGLPANCSIDFDVYRTDFQYSMMENML